MEKAKFIDPVIDSSGQPTSAGTVSAGYQNFLICIEMLFAALALRAAFPYEIYANNSQTGTGNPTNSRTVTMQSISSSLKVRLKIYNIYLYIVYQTYLLILNWWFMSYQFLQKFILFRKQ